MTVQYAEPSALDGSSPAIPARWCGHPYATRVKAFFEIERSDLDALWRLIEAKLTVKKRGALSSNRTLATLRAGGLIKVNGRCVELTGLEALERLGQFQPLYLVRVAVRPAQGHLDQQSSPARTGAPG